MNIDSFRQNFKGVRTNRFLVEAFFPTNEGFEKANIYIKSADVPGSNIGTIPVAWQGRVIKFPSDRAYAEWSINCYESNVKSEDLRELFENWINAMDTRNGHSINYNLTEDWVIRWSDLTNFSTPTGGESQLPNHFNKAIKLKNCWPTDLGPAPLNYDVSDAFSEFTVTLAYDYWEPTDAATPVAPATEA